MVECVFDDGNSINCKCGTCENVVDVGFNKLECDGYRVLDFGICELYKLSNKIRYSQNLHLTDFDVNLIENKVKLMVTIV